MKRFLNYIAGSFLRHLDFELSRPDSLLETVVVGEKTPREWTLPVREALLELFPHLRSAPPHPRNFVEELNIRNERNTYYNSTFEGLNVIFFEAIKDLCEQTPESRKRYWTVTSNADFYHALEDRIDHYCPQTRVHLEKMKCGDQ